MAKATPPPRETHLHVRGTEPQMRFWASEARYRAFVGGVGSGKTYAGSIEALRMPPSRGAIIAPTYRMLMDATLDTFLDIARTAGMLKEFIKSEMRAELWNGTDAIFRSADEPDKLRGPNLGWFWLDEAAMMPELVMDIMLGRLRLGPGRAWLTTTPKGMGWLPRLFKDEGRADYTLIQCSTDSNIYLPDFFIDSLKGKYKGSWFEQEFGGQFVDWVSAPVYERFHRARNVRPDLMRYYRDRLPLKVGVDYNARCMAWPVIQVNGRKPRVLCEIAQVGRTSIPEMGMLLKLRFPNHSGGIEIFPDATGSGINVQTGLSSHDMLMASMRGHPSRVQLNAPFSNPSVRDRVNSVNALMDGTGEWDPIEIDESCEMLIRDLSQVEWDDRGTGIKKITNLEDERSTLTHASDALGYWASLDAPLATVYLDREEDGVTVPSALNPFNAKMGPRELIERLKAREELIDDDDWSSWI